MDGARILGRLTPGWRRPRLPLWTGILIAVAVFAALALTVGPGDIRAPSLPPELARQPDAYLEDGTISQFRADGALHYRMQVERATYFDQGGTAEVTAPVVEYFAPSAVPWRIEAASAEIRNVTAPDGATEERAGSRRRRGAVPRWRRRRATRAAHTGSDPLPGARNRPRRSTCYDRTWSRQSHRGGRFRG